MAEICVSIIPTKNMGGTGEWPLRAPTVDVRYVPNAKYLAHIPHQTQKIGF